VADCIAAAVREARFDPPGPGGSNDQRAVPFNFVIEPYPELARKTFREAVDQLRPTAQTCFERVPRRDRPHVERFTFDVSTNAEGAVSSMETDVDRDIHSQQDASVTDASSLSACLLPKVRELRFSAATQSRVRITFILFVEMKPPPDAGSSDASPADAAQD
jgi:hypothetical protein